MRNFCWAILPFLTVLMPQPAECQTTIQFVSARDHRVVRADEIGYELVPDRAAYVAAKADANRAAGHKPAIAPSGPPGLSPGIITSFEGIHDPIHANPDEVSAIGPDRLVELINTRFGIFDRQGNLLAEGSAEELTGAAVFLASEDADSVTGATLYVDRGWSAY